MERKRGYEGKLQKELHALKHKKKRVTGKICYQGNKTTCWVVEKANKEKLTDV